MKQKQDSDRKKSLITFVIVWVVQMAAAFYFCTQKQGFHEDEYYTCYSTSRTNGFYVEDGQWMDRETYRNEFVVLPEERFQYGLVKLVQSWDVHPPMYYWVFHTAASLVPNVFSKWIGLSVNLFFHGINIILLTRMSNLVFGRGGRLSLFVSLFWGLSPAVMSGVVFIRMYEMLTTFVLLCGVLHVQAVKKNEEKLPILRCLIPMAAVTYFGFLTQYYYFIFLFFLAIAFCVWLLWRDRNLWNCIRYGISQGTALGLAYLTYPSCLGQMFRGQRGAQATENFLDWSNTVERIGFFYDLMNRYVFGHMFSVLLLLILVFAVYKRHVVGHSVTFYMLTFTAVGYFLTVSKTALLLGETSVRYQLPIYGIVVLLVFMDLGELWEMVIADCMKNRRYVKYVKYANIAAVGLCLAAILLGHWKDGVVFLYPEDEEQIAFAGECAAQGTPAVYLYQPGEEWCIWDVADELFMYPKVYFAAADENFEDIGFEAILNDAGIQDTEPFVVYMTRSAEEADGKAPDMRVAGDKLKSGRGTRMFDEKYCTVWYYE